MEHISTSANEKNGWISPDPDPFTILRPHWVCFFTGRMLSLEHVMHFLQSLGLSFEWLKANSKSTASRGDELGLILNNYHANCMTMVTGKA